MPAPGGVEETVGANELTAFINEWLDGLNKEDAALFVKRYWYGETVGELSKKLGVSPKRLSDRLYELRKKLRVFLERKGITV